MIAPARRPVLLVALLLVPAGWSVADPPAPGAGTAKGDDPLAPTDPAAAELVRALDQKAEAQKYPLPQDPARGKKLADAALAWCRRHTTDAFDKTGDTGAASAGKARAALDAWAAELAAPLHRGMPHHAAYDRTNRAVLAAAAAGSTDPLVKYLLFRAETRPGKASVAETWKRYRDAAVGVFDSRYTDVRKLHVADRMLPALTGFAKTLEGPDELALWEKRYWELFERVAADPDPVGQWNLVMLTTPWMEWAMTRGRTRDQAHAEVARHLERAKTPETTRLLVRSGFLIRWAWDARGGGYAGTVTEQGWKDFRARLTEAEAVVEQAWKADPECWPVPGMMLTVSKGLGHDRDEMEKWFARAMRANPNNSRACAAKLEYLQPKWHGTADDVVGFGWQCVRTRNTAGGLPFIPLDADFETAPVIGPRYIARLQEVRRYYAEPARWQVMETALGLTLRDEPDNRYARTLYARMACIAGRYEVAEREFRALGDDYSRSLFEGPAEYALYRKWAKDGMLPGEARPATPAPPKKAD